MPSVRLTFPHLSTLTEEKATEETADETQEGIPYYPGAALMPPQVELQLSTMERIRDRIRWRLHQDRARLVLDHREKWRAGVYKEIVFWDEYLRDQGGQYHKDYLKRIDPNLPLQPELVEIFALPRGSVLKILDVGSGPLTWVGKKSPDWIIEITAVDPLAEAYDQLLAAHNLVPPVRTRNVAAEELHRAFRPRTFNLVMARNCLDHALDPIGAIQQMLDLVKPGGAVFLAHAVNEAITNEYDGLHQWNFRLDGADFVIEGPGVFANINTLLRDRATVSSEFLWDHWLQTTIRPR